MSYQRPAPTAAELREGGNHLLYEVQMLANAAALLEDDSSWNKGWGWQSKTLYMSVIESFLTHARSLMDFVCPPSDYATRKVHERGIFAADYCSSLWRPQPWGSLRAEHKSISTEIEHLSLDRPAVAREWPYVAMLSKLTAMLVSFVAQADQLSPHVRDQVRAILVDGVHVSTADADVPGFAISTTTLTAISGVSGATTSLIDPFQIQ